MQTHKIRFIDNSYELGNANELLNRLILQKIDFIKDQILETEDVTEMNQLKQRIIDLKAESRSLDLFIQEFEGEKVEMEIGCTIIMAIKQSDKK